MNVNLSPNRRDFLYGLGATLGTVAFNAMLQSDAVGRDDATSAGPLAPKPPHFQGRAKRCIFLFLEGGPSHIDTFDPKPKLKELHMQEFVRQSKFISKMASGNRYYIASPFEFHRAGQSGLWMCKNYRHLAGVADELCVYHGCQGESINHPTACYHMNTGSRFGGEPAVGSWTCYGLGTENQNVPGFIVLPEVNLPQGGSANWSNGYLPAYYQGTPLRAKGSPILDLNPPPGVTRDVQRANLDLLAKKNGAHHDKHPQHRDLTARMEAYELAFRMQMQVPDIIDIQGEPAETKALYGIGDPDTDAIGRRCLLARKLVSQGVRFVQIFAGGWDSHERIARTHGNLIKSVDKPFAGLIKDLRRSGLLDDTLVVACGEFGRSPDNGVRQGSKTPGRDHNAKGMAIWLAGGGVNSGHAVGATDETGAEAVEDVHPIKDLHVTILHLLGLDDNKLTYFHGGRFKQLSQTGGKVIEPLLA